jgi:SAM-dependent methyltransferase
MRLGERVLLALSRDPDAPDYPEGRQTWDADSALSLLTGVCPDFLDRIQGRRVMDYGSGFGWQVVACVQKGAAFAFGVDIDAEGLGESAELAKAEAVESRVAFGRQVPPALYGTFDLVFSQNSMEHLTDPDYALREMVRAVKPTGRILITFGPPWFAPYGSHTNFFTRLPWVNILFLERTVMSVRSRFRSDGATRYVDAPRGPNKMTVARFDRLLRAHGFIEERRDNGCVKGLDSLGKIPVLRELFINHITAVLVPPASADAVKSA